VDQFAASPADRRAKLQVMGGEPSSGSHTPDGFIAGLGCSLQCAILLAYWWVLLSSASGLRRQLG
jgi:hypothetical protein